jgi:hypothetical protein
MDFDTDKLSGWLGLGHLQQTIAHAKTNFDNASACTAEGLIPIEAPVLQRETELGETFLPAPLLTGSRSTSTHHKTAYPIIQRRPGGSHGDD